MLNQESSINPSSSAPWERERKREREHFPSLSTLYHQLSTTHNNATSSFAARPSACRESKMSAKAIREYSGKSLVSKYLTQFCNEEEGGTGESYEVEDRCLLITSEMVNPADPQSFLKVVLCCS